MIAYAKIIALVLLVTACAAAGYAAVSAYNGAIAKAERLDGENKLLTQSLTTQIAENGRLKAVQAVTDKLLAERQVQRQAAAEIERKASDAIQRIVANSPAARDWWTGRVPDELRISSAAAGDVKNDRGAPAGKPAAAGAGP